MKNSKDNHSNKVNEIKAFILNCFILILSIYFSGCGIHYNKGIQLYQENQYDRAIEELNKSKPIKKAKRAEKHFYLGLAYLKKNDTTNAINHLKLATELDPSNIKYNLRMGEALIKRGMFSNAAKYFDIVLNINPNNLLARNSIAFCYMKMYRFQEALNQYSLVVSADPSNATAHYNLAEIYEKYIKNIDKAAEHYRMFLALEPNSNLAPQAKAFLDKYEAEKGGLSQIFTPTEEIPAELSLEAASYLKNKRVLVLDITSPDISLIELSTISDYLRTKLFNLCQCEVPRKEDVLPVLEELIGKYGGRCRQTECMAELGNLMKADKIINTKIGKIGQQFTILLDEFDVAKKEELVHISFSYLGEKEGLIPALEKTVIKYLNSAVQPLLSPKPESNEQVKPDKE